MAVIALLEEFADEAAILRRRAKNPVEQAAAARVESLLKKIRGRLKRRSVPPFGREGRTCRSGRKFSPLDLAFLQTGRTTMTEVLRDFGDPCDRRNAPEEGSVFLYAFVERFASTGVKSASEPESDVHRRMVQTTKITFDGGGIVAGVESSTGLSWRYGRCAY